MVEAVNVLIVGAGKIAERHARAWKQLAGDNVWICDLVPELAQKRANQLGVHIAKDPLTAVEDARFDVVDICVPTPSHALYAVKALEEGKHVFIEKPLSLTEAEGEAILTAALDAGRHVQVGYLFRYHPVFCQVKAWLENELIGQPHLVLVRMGGKGSAAAWKHNRQEGGGAVNEMLVHKLDLLMWFFGGLELKQVLLKETLLPTRRIGDTHCEADAEDFILAQFRSRETLILLQSDLASPAYVENVEIHGSEGSIVASVQEGSPNYLFLKEPRGGMADGYHNQEVTFVDLFFAELSAFSQKLNSPPCYEDLKKAVKQVGILEKLRSGNCIPS